MLSRDSALCRDKDPQSAGSFVLSTALRMKIMSIWLWSSVRSSERLAYKHAPSSSCLYRTRLQRHGSSWYNSSVPAITCIPIRSSIVIWSSATFSLMRIWTSKLVTLALPRFWRAEEDYLTSICGTPSYIAPEVLFDTANGHSFEVDTWSIGVILYTFVVGRPPFQTKDVKEVYQWVFGRPR